MKRAFIIYLFILLLSCNSNSSIQNPEGIYTCTFEHEFAKTEDSLLLQRANENYFKITRHSGVTNKTNKRKKVISEVWKLEYDKGKKAFTELKRGRIILWNADEDLLVFGNRDYVKLKN